MGILFKKATVVNADDTYQADVLVEGELIRDIRREIDPSGHSVVDCIGKYLLPGGIDVHTHLELPYDHIPTVSNDDFETGHIAAAFGGTTTHIDFVSQPKGGSLADGLKQWRKKAEPAIIDYGFHMTITDFNSNIAAEIPTMLDEGISSLKLLMAYKGTIMIDDDALFRTMLIAKEHGMLVMVHAENGDVEAVLRERYLDQGKVSPWYFGASRPPQIEGEATNRAVMMSGLTKCPLYVVHMTCLESLFALQLGRNLGYPVMGETCTHYLFLTAEEHLGAKDYNGAKYVAAPPIRTIKDHEALWEALKDGTLQAISTDHCDFWEQGGVGPWQAWHAQHGNRDWAKFEAQDPTYRRPGKEQGRDNFSKIPTGLPGIEDRMIVGWHHCVNVQGISPNQFVELHCTNPAKIFGMYPQKGVIEMGSDADLLVWNPNAEKTISAQMHHMRVDYNIYEGMRVRGLPEQVYLRGRKIVDGDEWLGEKGSGKFIHREAYGAVI